MTEYRCRKHVQLYNLSLLLLFGGIAAYFIIAPLLHPAEYRHLAEKIGILLLAELICGGIACWGAVGLQRSLAIFRLDESGILKRAWNGREQQFAWTDITLGKMARKGSLTLTEFHGERMSIPAMENGYRSPEGKDLHHVLRERLASAAK